MTNEMQMRITKPENVSETTYTFAESESERRHSSDKEENNEKDVLIESGLTSDSKNYKREDAEQNSRSHFGDADASADADSDDVPFDRGWAWMIVLAHFLNIFIMVGYVKAMGVLFVEFLAIYQASVTMTTLLMFTIAGTYSVSSFLTMQVTLSRLRTRRSVVIGGVVTSLGITLSYFADSVLFLIFVQGTLVGIGHGMVNGPGLILIGQYFKKRRGIATAIGICGVSVGSSVFPPFVNFLLEELSLKETFLILGGINLNIVVGGMLLRPVSFYKKRSRREQKARQADDVSSLKGGNECVKSWVKDVDLLTKSLDVFPVDNLPADDYFRKRTFSESLNQKPSWNSRRSAERSVLILSSTPEIASVSVCDLTGLKRSQKLESSVFLLTSREEIENVSSGLNSRTITEHGQNDSTVVNTRQSTEHEENSSTVVNTRQSTEHEENSSTVVNTRESTEHEENSSTVINTRQSTEHEENSSTVVNTRQSTEHEETVHEMKSLGKDKLAEAAFSHRLLNVLKTPFTLLDFSVFKNPLFVVFISAAVFAVQLAAVLTYVPAVAVENGISQSDAAALLTIAGSLDLLSKLAFGWFADLDVVAKHHLEMIALCLTATASLFVSMYSSFPLMVGYVVAYGMFGGVYSSLYPLVLIDFVGLENMAKAFGFVQLIHGAVIAVTHPIIGSLRDFTGSYSASFQYTAVCGFVGAGILFLEKWVRRRHDREKHVVI